MRKKSARIIKEKPETKAEIFGDIAGAWKIEVTRELQQCGYKIN